MVRRHPTRGMLGWFDRLSALQAHQRAGHRARQQRGEYARQETSGAHDSGGVATGAEIVAAGLRSGHLYLGADAKGEFLFYGGQGSLITAGKPSIGKGATLIQPNQAWIENDCSIVITDPGHENYRVCAEYRRDVLGQLVVASNPSGAYGIPSVNVDPIAHIREAGRRGDFKAVERLTREFKHVLLPQKKNDRGDAQWVLDGAQTGVLQPLIVFAAMERPNLCTLPDLYELLSKPPQEMLTLVLGTSSLEYVHRRMEALMAELEVGAEKQLFWKLEKARSALEPYERGTELGDAMSGPPFDPATLRMQPTTLYLTPTENSLEAQAVHLACTITSLVEQLADTEGPQKIIFMIDEASNLPAMALPRWVRLYRKRKLQFWTFWQSLSSIEEVYGKAGRNDLLASCDVVQHLSVEPETARRLSERAGTRTILGRSMNFGGDGRSAQDSMSEQRQSRLPAADILNMPRHAQILEVTGLGLIKGVRPPWWEIDPFAARLKHFDQMKDQVRHGPRTPSDN